MIRDYHVRFCERLAEKFAGLLDLDLLHLLLEVADHVFEIKSIFQKPTQE